MKQLKFILIFMMLPALTSAGASIDTFLKFKENVRQSLRLESTVSLPDTAFIDMANRALLRTSVDWGGVESRIRIITVARQEFYALPDTLVEILTQTTINNSVTKQLKQMLPHFLEDLGYATKLPSTTADPDAVPLAYTYIDDTLQFIPVPTKADDTMWFYAFMEHEVLSADADSIRMRPAFTDVAVYKCCQFVLESLDMKEDAAYYEALYDKYGLKTRQKYLKRLDILPGISQ